MHFGGRNAAKNLLFISLRMLFKGAKSASLEFHGWKNQVSLKDSRFRNRYGMNIAAYTILAVFCLFVSLLNSRIVTLLSRTRGAYS
jgi:hypothetical protein